MFKRGALIEILRGIFMMRIYVQGTFARAVAKELAIVVDYREFETIVEYVVLANGEIYKVALFKSSVNECLRVISDI